MGAFFSRLASGDRFYNIFYKDGGKKVYQEVYEGSKIYEGSVKKIAAPPQSSKKCSDEHACKMEDMEIAALKKMNEIADANDKKLNITSDTFDEYWDSIQKNAKILDLLKIPTFSEERGEVAEAFQGNDFEKRREAMAKYKKAVDEYLLEIVTKNSADSEQAQSEKPVDKKK